MEPTINSCLRAKNAKGVYTVSIRYYLDGKEDYYNTEHRITREEWEAGESDLVLDIRVNLRDRVKKAKDLCEGDHSYERFKLAMDNKPLTPTHSLIALLDKHLEMNKAGLLEEPAYAQGTIDLYTGCRKLLVRIQDGVPEKELPARSLNCDNFKTTMSFKELESWMSAYAKRGIGNTVLSMHMRVVKAVCKTGHNPDLGLGWIKSDAYDRYSKPTAESGTEPIKLDDFLKILNFTPHIMDMSSHKEVYQAQSFQFGKDFWCFMVQTGGMEAKDICLLKWPKVNEEEGYFSYTRSKTEADQHTDTMISYTDNPHLKYVIEHYGVKANKATGSYVFPFLNDEMTEIQKDAAIQAFYSRVTKVMGRISIKLDVSPKATCKRARPTFATIAADSGKMDIYAIGKMMNHKKISTTEIYLKNLPLKSKLKFSKTAATIYAQ